MRNKIITTILISCLLFSMMGSLVLAKSSIESDSIVDQFNCSLLLSENKTIEELEQWFKREHEEYRDISLDEALNHKKNIEVFKYLTEDEIVFFKAVEQMKLKSKTKNISTLIKKMDKYATENNIIGTFSYDHWYDRLTTCEKALIILSPANGAKTYYTVGRATDLTIENFEHNGCGDQSDAFRHAIWNLLMCKYVDKPWAQAFATAHECASEEELQEEGCHGFTKAEHTVMDLHNNQEGRDLWIWYDIFPSDQNLVNRVLEKINDNTLIWLVD